MAVHVWKDGIDGLQKIGRGHVGMRGACLAVASAVAAVKIAPLGAFPEKLPKLMLPCALMAQDAFSFKSYQPFEP